MATITSSRNLFLQLLLAVFVIAIISVLFTRTTIANTLTDKSTSHSSTFAAVSVSNINVDYHVDENCKNLPTIRHSGTYFLDGNIKAGDSAEGVTPSFKVGSYYAEKVQFHMRGDRPIFHLMKDALKGKEGSLVFDMGANQGFYTYYLASLGIQVHSFDINDKNFKALQHGAEFNSREVADRVHLYPVGLGQENARFSMKGNEYTGFLKEGNDGPILGVIFDCFAHHMREKLDISKVAFVKLYVEGFEIAFLKSAQNSLFKPGPFNVGTMIMGVGLDRWDRASVDLASGVEEMKKLSMHFQSSYILIRGDKKCPTALIEVVLSDKKPKAIDGVNMFAIKLDEWEPL